MTLQLIFKTTIVTEIHQDTITESTDCYHTLTQKYTNTQLSTRYVLFHSTNWKLSLLHYTKF